MWESSGGWRLVVRERLEDHAGRSAATGSGVGGVAGSGREQDRDAAARELGADPAV